MTVELIGIMTILVGVLCIFLGYEVAVIVFTIITLLGSAAAINAGGASVQPAHLFLIFLAFVTLTWTRHVVAGLRAFGAFQPAFWLGCLVVYGAFSGYFMPRLLAGTTQIIPLGASEFPDTGGTVPLGPLSSNWTQTVYLALDLLCFVTVLAICSRMQGFLAVMRGVVACAAVNIVLAATDLATTLTHTEFLLDFIRNAHYALHAGEVVAGATRIIGSFPEASAFAATTLGPLGFTMTMFLCGYYPRWTGPLSALSIGFVLCSTSSTGVVAVPLCLILFYAIALKRCGTGRKRKASTAFVLFLPIALVVVIGLFALQPTLLEWGENYINVLIFTKATTSSGIERASWNTNGFQNFLDSWGLGVGLGSARTSSFPIALLSNVGVPGTTFFAIFLWQTLWNRGQSQPALIRDIQTAARIGCLCLLIGAVISGATVDLGLLFFILAALANASPITSALSSKTSADPRLQDTVARHGI